MNRRLVYLKLPVWISLNFILSVLPVNFLIIESLERYYFYYGDDLKVEHPTGSGNMMNLLEISKDLCVRTGKLFLPDEKGRRPCHGSDTRYQDDPHWKDLVLFYEYFDGDTGRGCGARYNVKLFPVVRVIVLLLSLLLQAPFTQKK